MNRDAAGAVKHRGGIAAVHRAQRIVDAAIGRPFEYGMATPDLDEVKPQLRGNRRLPPVRNHRAELLEAVGRVFSGRVHRADHGSWKGRTSARNDQASRG